MTTLPQIWANILIWLGVRESNSKELEGAVKFSLEYNDKKGINLTYSASNKIANFVTTDSQLNITSDKSDSRVDFLSVCANKLWKHKKRIVSRAAGVGKVCLFPYTDDCKNIKYCIVPQSNIVVLAQDGEKATDISVLCDTATVNEKLYGKFKRYMLQGTTHIITEFYTDLTANIVIGSDPPSGVTRWLSVEPLVIENVKQLLFGAVNCPIDSRTDDVFYAARITDGCEDIINDIKAQFAYLASEYKLKKAFVGVDKTLFRTDKKGKHILPDSQLFKIMDTGADDFFKIFDPAIRADPIFTRLKATFELLENQIGLSRGIYTSPENVGAYNNTSNIKRSVFDTYSFVTSFRDNLENGITDFLYACNVLAEYFGMTPQGIPFEDIGIRIDWSNAMIENSAEEFNQYAEGVAQGIISRSELRQWITGEDIETATKKVDEIQENMPLVE